jgi:hypothetical protein
MSVFIFFETELLFTKTKKRLINGTACEKLPLKNRVTPVASKSNVTVEFVIVIPACAKVHSSATKANTRNRMG